MPGGFRVLGLALTFSAAVDTARRGRYSSWTEPLCGDRVSLQAGGCVPAIAVVTYPPGLAPVSGRARRWPWERSLTGAGILAAGLRALPAVRWHLQSFLLHLMKGSPLPLGGASCCGLGREVGTRSFQRRWLAWLAMTASSRSHLFLMLWAGLELLFMLQLSSTFWPHYMVTPAGSTRVVRRALASRARGGRRGDERRLSAQDAVLPGLAGSP